MYLEIVQILLCYVVLTFASDPATTLFLPEFIKTKSTTNNNNSTINVSSLDDNPIITQQTDNNKTTQKYVHCLARSDLDNDSKIVELVNDTTLLKLLVTQTNITSRDIPAPCILVLFYSPYCPFSGQAAPHYNALPRAFTPIKMVAVNAMLYHLFNTQNGIVGVPSLMLFHNGRAVAKFNESDYTLDAFTRFVTKHTGLVAEARHTYVSSADFAGPINSVPVHTPDVYLILSWLFIVACGSYYFARSKWWQWIAVAVQRTWRESQVYAQQRREHND